MVKTYIQKKEDTIEAIQWTGNNTNDVIEFGSYRVDDCLYKDIQLPPEDLQEKLKQPELWISNMYGGDVVTEDDYVVIDDGEYIKIDKIDFEKNWILKEGNTYKSKTKKTLQAIQWTDETTDEIKDFIGKSGGLDATGQTFILMNLLGGSVVYKGDFVVKIPNEFGNSFYGISEKELKKKYKEKDTK